MEVSIFTNKVKKMDAKKTPKKEVKAPKVVKTKAK
jgi:hypothetical protein